MTQASPLTLPVEQTELMELQGSGMSALCLVNKSMLQFEHKALFDWHCSLTLDLADCGDNGMPSAQERDQLNAFFTKIDGLIKANNNAVWLARVTWNKTQELIWRVHNPQLANDIIQAIISKEDHPLPFDYRIEPDTDWSAAAWLLDPLRK